MTIALSLHHLEIGHKDKDHGSKGKFSCTNNAGTRRWKMTHPLDVMPQGVALHYLFRLVPIDDGLEAVKGATAHHVADAFLLDAEPLYLVVDVEEQRVVTRGVV